MVLAVVLGFLACSAGFYGREAGFGGCSALVRPVPGGRGDALYQGATPRLYGARHICVSFAGCLPVRATRGPPVEGYRADRLPDGRTRQLFV